MVQRFDYLVIGSGIAGMSFALKVANEGGAAQSWWESYLATHAHPDAITWEEFRGSFR